MAISHEDLLLVISVGPHLPFFKYTGLRYILCSNIPIRQSALLHTCTKGLICSQDHLFLFLHIQTCFSFLVCSAHMQLKFFRSQSSWEWCNWRNLILNACTDSHTQKAMGPAVTTFAYRCQISAGLPIMSGRSILLTVFSRWDSIGKGDWEKLNAGGMRRDMQIHLTLHIKSNVFINKPLACLQMACSSVPSSDNSLELNI